jgi:hypothetical protein
MLGLWKNPPSVTPGMKIPVDERRTQILVCAAILLTLTLAMSGLLMGWRHLPGLLGEWTGFIVGIMTSPFFMEASFAVIGLTIVLAVNHWREKKSGDELMHLEQVEDAAGLPEHASWALYREPLAGEQPPLLAQAEGALAIGDHESAAECLAEMPEKDLKRADVLKVRMDLARATGRSELAAQLESELQNMPR